MAAGGSSTLPAGIASLSLLTRRSLLTRLDLLPAVPMYLLLVYLAGTPKCFLLLGEFSYPLFLSVGGITHTLCFLFEVWSVSWHAFVAFSPSPTLERATHMLVVPDLHAGAPAVVALLERGLEALGDGRA